MNDLIVDNIVINYDEYIGEDLFEDLCHMAKCRWLNKEDVRYLGKLIYQKQDLSASKSLTKVTATSIVLESIPDVVHCYGDWGYGSINNLYTLKTDTKKVRDFASKLSTLLDVKDYITVDFELYYTEYLADIILSGLYDRDTIYLTSLWMAYKMASYKRSL